MGIDNEDYWPDLRYQSRPVVIHNREPKKMDHEIIDGRLVLYKNRCLCGSINCKVVKTKNGFPFLRCFNCGKTTECIYK